MAFEQNLFRVDSTILNVLLRGCYRFSVFRKLKKKNIHPIEMPVKFLSSASISTPACDTRNKSVERFRHGYRLRFTALARPGPLAQPLAQLESTQPSRM